LTTHFFNMAMPADIEQQNTNLYTEGLKEVGNMSQETSQAEHRAESIERIEYRLPTRDEVRLYVRAHVPTAPWAVLQIAHGMSEHSLRYDDFAQAMAAEGIAVYVNDHAGHGQSAPPEHYGVFDESDGWYCAMEDLHSVRASVQQRHPGLPMLMLGHSMGSMLMRSYIVRHASGLRGVVLSGANGPNPIVGIAKLLAGFEKLRLPTYAPAKRIDKLVFGAYGKLFAPTRTPFDWLSRDAAQVDAYVADPACGFPFTATGYRDVFNGVAEIQAADWASRVPAELPILMISGDRDPVGGMGKGVRKVEAMLRNAGVHDLTCTLYPDARHEPLNETCKAQVYADLLAWFRRVAG
jgi:alpha-beta hydrolase superfamily lysophospholipase